MELKELANSLLYHCFHRTVQNILEANILFVFVLSLFVWAIRWMHSVGSTLVLYLLLKLTWYKCLVRYLCLVRRYKPKLLNNICCLFSWSAIWSTFTCTWLTLLVKLKWPCEYCSMTSVTSYGLENFNKITYSFSKVRNRTLSR